MIRTALLYVMAEFSINKLFNSVITKLVPVSTIVFEKKYKYAMSKNKTQNTIWEFFGFTPIMMDGDRVIYCATKAYEHILLDVDYDKESDYFSANRVESSVRYNNKLWKTMRLEFHYVYGDSVPLTEIILINE